MLFNYNLFENIMQNILNMITIYYMVIVLLIKIVGVILTNITNETHAFETINGLLHRDNIIKMSKLQYNRREAKSKYKNETPYNNRKPIKLFISTPNNINISRQDHLRYKKPDMSYHSIHYQHYHKPYYSKGYRKFPKFHNSPSSLKFMKSTRKKPYRYLSNIISTSDHIMLPPTSAYDFIEGDNLQTGSLYLPFKSIDSYPHLKSKLQPFEIIDDASDVAPVILFDNDTINPQPLSVINKLPRDNIWPLIEFPSKKYTEKIQRIPDLQNTHLTSLFSYVDNNTNNLLHQFKLKDLNSETSIILPQNQNKTTNAVAEWLLPLLSKAELKTSQLKNLYEKKNSETEKKNMKIIYVIEDNISNNVSLKADPSTQFSAGKPVQDQELGETLFVMVKQPLMNESIDRMNNTASPSATTNNTKSKSTELKSQQTQNEDNLALQKYIMTLAGINKDNRNRSTKSIVMHKNKKIKN